VDGSLRVLVRDGAALGLMSHLTHTGDEVFGGSGATGVANLKVTYHADGKNHVQLEPVGATFISPDATKRRRSEPLAPPYRFAGRHFVGSSAYSRGVVRWDYAEKESDTRANLTLDMHHLRNLPGWAVDLWFLEHGHPDEPHRCLGEYNPVRVLATEEVSWTQPRLFAVAWTLPDVSWFELAVAEGLPLALPGRYLPCRTSLDGFHVATVARGTAY
jgi:hypothetical protein